MIEDFKSWLTELGENAVQRKNAIALKTGKRPKWTSTKKNKEIKEKFTREGLKLSGIKPRSSADRKAGEWLYDLIWREFDSGNFLSVKLAMEIELSDMEERGLVYDYNKLLQSDSKYKVFVFQQKTKDEAKHIFGQLESRSKIYKNRTESSTLLCCWCWDTGTFLFHDFSSQVCME